MENKPYKIYFASPFFNSEQVEREEELKSILREIGYEVWSPKENCFLPPDSTDYDRKKVFMQNLNAILDCDASFVVTDGKDMGSIWEAGFSYGCGKPIIYYCETLPEGGKFNLMLAKSGNMVLTNRKEILDRKYDIDMVLSKNISFNYKGLIE